MEIILPTELWLLILDNITDTKTYLNSRLVCKLWYDKLKVGKIFFDNKLFLKIFYYQNKIEYLDLNNNLVKLINFDKYGFYNVKEYDNNKMTRYIKNKPPYSLESTVYGKTHMEIVTLDVRNSNVKKKIIPNGMPIQCCIF